MKTFLLLSFFLISSCNPFSNKKSKTALQEEKLFYKNACAFIKDYRYCISAVEEEKEIEDCLEKREKSLNLALVGLKEHEISFNDIIEPLEDFHQTQLNVVRECLKDISFSDGRDDHLTATKRCYNSDANQWDKELVCNLERK